jgi:hypothetical protein
MTLSAFSRPPFAASYQPSAISFQPFEFCPLPLDSWFSPFDCN